MTRRHTHSLPIEVRFSDLDAYGHVNNAVYFTYFETARTRLFLEPFQALGRQGLLLLVVRAECDYQKPIELTDRVVVDLVVERVGRSSFDLAYTLHNGAGTIFATAKTVMVCFDAKLGKPVAVPAALLAEVESDERSGN
jgi:acyl-CoA thioester hydrolase